MRPFSGYGDISRGLLTGELDAGVLPWELAVTDLLLKPGQRGEWRIPAVLRPGPMELVLGASTAKLVASSRRRHARSASVSLVFGIEARNSFTRFQILAWQEGKSLPHLAPPSFKVLPMHLMIKGLEAGEVDGVLAPTPWGMQAERGGVGTLDEGFGTGEHSQHLVLVCRRDVSQNLSEQLSRLPEDLLALGDFATDRAKFDAAALKMNSLGPPRLDPELLWEAAGRHSAVPAQAEFIPDESWFSSELDLLARRFSLETTPGPLAELARSLSFLS